LETQVAGIVPAVADDNKSLAGIRPSLQIRQGQRDPVSPPSAETTPPSKGAAVAGLMSFGSRQL
jgi:hypothetical protein